MIFAKTLRKLRKEKGITMEELAHFIDVSYSLIAMYENDKRQPTPKTLQALADYFNVSIDYLLGRTDNPKTALIEGDDVPKELRDLGVEYFTIAKELKDAKIPPDDIRKIVEAIKNINK
jgi:transcriptional regulator with XRE-family HTH domain